MLSQPLPVLQRGSPRGSVNSGFKVTTICIFPPLQKTHHPPEAMLFLALPEGIKSLLPSFPVTGCHGNRDNRHPQSPWSVCTWSFAWWQLWELGEGVSGCLYGPPMKQAAEKDRAARSLPVLPPLANSSVRDDYTGRGWSMTLTQRRHSCRGACMGPVAAAVKGILCGLA